MLIRIITYFRAYETFIIINRWNYVESRGLHRDCKTPQLADDSLKKYMVSKNQVGQQDDDSNMQGNTLVIDQNSNKRKSQKRKVAETSQNDVAKMKKARSLSAKKGHATRLANAKMKAKVLKAANKAIGKRKLPIPVQKSDGESEEEESESDEDEDSSDDEKSSQDEKNEDQNKFLKKVLAELYIYIYIVCITL